MTLVCVRWDNSFGYPRFTALADTRASIPLSSGARRTVSDTTVKLFVVPIRCVDIANLTPIIGARQEPYFETKIGIGFSGSCFEALTIIAIVTQMFEALSPESDGEPRPCGEGIVNFVGRAVQEYFNAHSGDGKPVLHLLVFGFDDDQPWIGKVSWTQIDGLKQEFSLAHDDTIETIGETKDFETKLDQLRHRIRKHKDGLNPATPGIEVDLEASKHDLAEKRTTEEELLLKIESEFVQSIGGVLQRLELGLHNHRVVAGFTQDDRPYLERCRISVSKPPAVLGPIKIIEKMGR